MVSEPIRILHPIRTMARGGAELRMLDVMRNIDRSEFHLSFCSYSGQEGSLDDEVRKLGGEVYYIPLKSISFPLRFIRLLKEGRFDVVHSPLYLVSGYILWLGAIAGVPGRIAHFRSTHSGRANTLRRRVQDPILASLIDRYATDILAVSEGAMTRVWGERWHSDARCQIVYDGIRQAPFTAAADTEAVREEFGFPPDCPLCIHVGRFARAKNHVRLIEIFARLSSRVPEARLLMAGRLEDASIVTAVREKISANDLSNTVAMPGERADIPRLLKAADLLLFPSVREGLPGAVLEAGAAGLPVLSSDVPGSVEIATYLPLVECLSLDVDNDIWVSRAEALMDTGQSAREAARESFASTNFTAEACAQKLSDIWRQFADVKQ